MSVDLTSQTHFGVIDGNGGRHYVECMMCALKLLKTYEQLNITTYCDYFGPNYPITVSIRQHGNVVISNPPNALVIAGGGCTKNRVVYNLSAANSLLAKNGNSDYLAKIQTYTNGVDGEIITVPKNSTVLAMSQAALKFGGGESSQNPPNDKTCEVCGMAVASEAQTRYLITDETGAVHYVECLMCALNLVNDYNQVNITTSCDWYGPIYTITVKSKNFGKEVTVDPPTAQFLNGGNCVVNRGAYNQTAADELLAKGYSQYTLTEQQYALPSNTEVTSVQNAALEYGQTTPMQPSQTNAVLAIVIAIGTVAIIASLLAFRKMKTSQGTEKK